MTAKKVRTRATEVRLNPWDELVGLFYGKIIQPDKSVTIFVKSNGVLQFIRCVIADPLYIEVMMAEREYHGKDINPIGFKIRILRTSVLEKPWCVSLTPFSRMVRRKGIKGTTRRRKTTKQRRRVLEPVASVTPLSAETQPDTLSPPPVTASDGSESPQADVDPLKRLFERVNSITDNSPREYKL